MAVWERPGFPPLPPERMADLVKRYRPRRWHVYQSRYRRNMGGSGLATEDLRTIRVPRLVDLWDLWTFLHECGHVHLRHFQRPDLTHHREEFEAERFAYHVLLAEGYTPPPLAMEMVLIRVEEALAEDMLLDPPVLIDPETVAFVEGGAL